VIGWNELGHAKLDDTIIDPLNGREDLRVGMIRHTGPAFKEDPVRILRTARFAARYDFDIGLTTDSLMKTMVIAGNLDHVTPERVWVEFEKALKAHSNSWKFLKTLEDIGALKVIMPRIVGSIDEDLKRRLDEADKNKNSVAIKCAMITSGIGPSFSDEIWMNVRAPNEVRDLADFSATVQWVFRHRWTGTAKEVLSTLKYVNAYRDESTLMDLICVIDAPYIDQALSLWSALKKTKHLSFADLTMDQQVNLKGKDIGEAIDQIRLDKIG